MPLCPDLRMGLVREGCTLVALALHPVKLHKLLVHFGWITWAGRNDQRFIFSLGPSFREGLLILEVIHAVSIGSIG